MKILLIFVAIAFCLASFTNAASTPEQRAEYKAIIGACMAEAPGVTNEILKKALMGDVDETNEGVKKVIFCMQTKKNAFKEDGSINVEQLKENMNKRFGTHDFDGIVDECAKDDQHDAEKNSLPLFKCLHSKMPKA